MSVSARCVFLLALFSFRHGLGVHRCVHVCCFFSFVCENVCAAVRIRVLLSCFVCFVCGCVCGRVGLCAFFVCLCLSLCVGVVAVRGCVCPFYVFVRLLLVSV